MKKTYYTGELLFTGSTFVKDFVILTEDAKIASLGTRETIPCQRLRARPARCDLCRIHTWPAGAGVRACRLRDRRIRRRHWAGV